jgi:hypothetical protein
VSGHYGKNFSGGDPHAPYENVGSDIARAMQDRDEAGGYDDDDPSTQRYAALEELRIAKEKGRAIE